MGEDILGGIVVIRESELEDGIAGYEVVTSKGTDRGAVDGDGCCFWQERKVVGG